MPTYVYECDTCSHSFEVFQSISDKPLRTCPECGARVRRLPGTGAALIFRGSGFYETDYKRSSKPAGARASGGCGDSCPKGTCPAAESSGD